MHQPTPRGARRDGRRSVAGLTAALLCAAGLATLPGTATASDADTARSTATATAAEQAPRLPDGLAKTPPMGFNNWNSTHCRAEFNEAMVKEIADIFVEKGLKKAGYQYVNLDDCWALPLRDASGRLVPDPKRFPNGIKAVADYVHSKGLKFGIYTSAGIKTCSPIGFPGALGHEVSDARQFADWGVDYLKYDNCNNLGMDAKKRYIAMRDALKATGRPIVYSICEWGENKPWEWASDIGHLWRTTGDINDSWGSMVSILKKNLPLAPYAGPGRWNDPDMLEVGNGGMTDTEYRSHFSLWSMMSSPLLIGTDLRKASAATFEILGNTEVIALDQDRLGKQATVSQSQAGRWTVVKELANGDRAVALFNESGQAQRITTTARDIGLPPADAYRLRDLWQHQDFNTAGTVSATVPAHGTALFRVSVDDRWAQYPPAVSADTDRTPLIEAARPARLTSILRNLGRDAAVGVKVSLKAPEGWTVRATSPDRAAALPPSKALTTGWRITAPTGTASGPYDLDLVGEYRAPGGKRVTVGLPVQARIVVPPPAGVSYASDLPWLGATNGWGPVEKDTSVGESGANDGGPLRIGGTTYVKGLGAHAASEVTYYVGGRCTAFDAWVGVDDETGAKGSVAFEVWADGRRAAATGTLTGADGPQAIAADVTGAETVRLVVTDGGDGTQYDHADWAEAAFDC